MQEPIISWIEQNLNVNPDTQTKIFYTLLVILLLFLARILANAILNRRVEDGVSLYRWRKSFSYLTLAIGISLIALIWLRGAGSIATYLGLVSAALVIALQDPITNLVGWVFIMSRHPFKIEDRIQIGDSAGDVIDIRFFQFSLNEIGNWVDADQSTGRVLHIPNRKVFSDNIANYTQGFDFLWNEIPVVITFESDWRKAKALLQEIAERHTVELSTMAQEEVRRAASRYLIYYKNLTPIVYTKAVDHGVSLSIRFLSGPRQRRDFQQSIWEDILDTIAKDPTIELAYPTQRYFYNPTEGPQKKPDQPIPPPGPTPTPQ